MSLIRKHVAVLQAWACLDLVTQHDVSCRKIIWNLLRQHICPYRMHSDTQINEAIDVQQ